LSVIFNLKFSEKPGEPETKKKVTKSTKTETKKETKKGEKSQKGKKQTSSKTDTSKADAATEDGVRSFGELRSILRNSTTADLAKKLIGVNLCRRVDGKKIIGRIVETEAYLGHCVFTTKIFDEDFDF